jgi:hypothetical protein
MNTDKDEMLRNRYRNGISLSVFICNPHLQDYMIQFLVLRVATLIKTHKLPVDDIKKDRKINGCLTELSTETKHRQGWR